MSILQNIFFMGIPILFAITVHEVSHGWMALRCGDRTAKVAGRLTLNPIKHVDMIGTILLPGLLILMHAPFLFGWAKPVPVDWRNLRNPKRDMALVALMGPVSNFVMALLWAFLFKYTFNASDPSGWMLMAKTGIMINTVLMVLNLLPLPPLDGSRVVSSLLSPRAAYQYNKLERYGFVILLLLLLTNILSAILSPLLAFMLGIISKIVGIY
ncbi:MAG: site-2 protease family protein [Gammaproteobacteria bacterium]|nr:site-2 protease family protein [Gammaproteobacteria bacterium]